MPFLQMEPQAGKKRKRTEKANTRPSKIKSAQPSDEQTLEDEVLQLESQVLESRKHYNNIPKLLALARRQDLITDDTLLSAIALCRIYTRLFASDALAKSKEEDGTEEVIVRWLRERLDEYIQLLCDSVRDGSETVQSPLLSLAMRMVKEQINYDGSKEWTKGIFPRVVDAALAGGEIIWEEFCATFCAEYDDVRVFTLVHLTERLHTNPDEELVNATINLLLELKPPPEENDKTTLFASQIAKGVQNLVSSKKQRKAAQGAWLAILKSPLSKQQNKQILGALVDSIVPWFTKVEMLMDYLTDSFNVGGATSLLALSGLFHLMQERNLDYPSFYQKLYSLLDEDLLHSKHRSRFFRLLDVFMGSTHLPAALVASFIKRLSRLALHAPPAAIVVVVPWIYNMFKRHPQCTFMLHRTARTAEQRAAWETEGFKDPFDASETDPMETQAIDSSVWEIVTLQSHWHPNVATLAKIVSEQFTKQSYNLEDFLDHSYKSLLDAELGKEMKKTPVVEWEIPKHVFLEETAGVEGLNVFGMLMRDVIQESS
ncbi:uncharacterized protein PV09_04862 [Verruconis gallopava]|uniref:CCAAT-binding factor domain-containing protein n=1 Tax=Verruconis gallopava TaxID=253628 RepID=A0A0D2AC14_9PEZI|nr:uncharacterized protein PV09_04862 [Verruconis gallopava]KIW04040.1 hypothetical protein PV09_04862 [Verruconis gallopava]